MTVYPDGNPKTAQGALKVPLHLVPPSATYYLALAFKDGATKYGPYNWRDKGVSASVYVAAAMRHIDAFRDGEDLSQDAQVHHLGHVMACCAIMLDAASVGMLNDDRPTKGAASALQSMFGLTPARALDMVSMEPPSALGMDLSDGVSPAVAALIERGDEEAPTAHLKAGEAIAP